MIVKTVSGRRKFEIFDLNWHFLMGVLAYDMTTNSTIYLSGVNRYITPYECCELSSVIKTVVSNNEIYELYDGIKVEPVFNPTAKVLSNLKRSIQPLTEKRRDFLLKFAEFIGSGDEMEVIL